MTDRPATGLRRGRILRTLGWLSGARTTGEPALVNLMRTARKNYPAEQLHVVERAYNVAAAAHDGQTRHSGQPYITHPLAVAAILSELAAPPAVLAAALLHDTVEDTSYTLGELTDEFSGEIAAIVDGVTKLDKVTHGDAAKAETLRKLMLAAGQDIRVLVVKLADRLHNARTWCYVPKESARRRQARETIDIYAPLANRLGLSLIQRELEDRCLGVLEPAEYERAAALIDDYRQRHQSAVEQALHTLQNVLDAANVAAMVTHRLKHHHAIATKTDTSQPQPHELITVHVLTDTTTQCYEVLGAIHSQWHPWPARFKDYISTPKLNMYQSLHTTVQGPGGEPLHLQIRTYDMHVRAELGITTRWRAPENRDELAEVQAMLTRRDETAATPGEELRWLQQLLDFHADLDSNEFLSSLRTEVDPDEVAVFTPAGELKNLPAGSTPLDSAYAIHTQLGHHCVAAVIDGNVVPLSLPLRDGQTVHILTDPDAGRPSPDWLEFTKTTRARTAIRRGLNTTPTVTERSSTARTGTPAPVGEAQHEQHAGIVTTDATKPRGFRLARCCRPFSGEPITAFLARGKILTVHRNDCPNAGGRPNPVGVDWAAWSAAVPTRICFEGLTEPRLLAKVTDTIGSHGLNITEATYTTTRNALVRGQLTIDLPPHITPDHILRAINDLTGVTDAWRAGSPNPEVEAQLLSTVTNRDLLGDYAAGLNE